MLEFNAYEFSGMDGRSIGRDGRFGYRFLDLYWSETERTPYLIWVDDELAGFALLRTEDHVLQVAEFLVLPRFRHGGVGTMAARELFGRHQGVWRVDQFEENVSATAFWRKAIPVPYDEVAEEDGRVVQRFTT